MTTRLLPLLLGALCFSTSAQAQNSLKEIAEFAKEMCTTIPITSTMDQTKLTADADAKLNGFLGKLATAGGSASAVIKRDATTGLLQSDLANAVKNSNDCRLVIFNYFATKTEIGPPSSVMSPVVENCRVWDTKASSIASAAEQFSVAVTEYSDAKDQQEQSIGARFPGNDPSFNIGMWTEKEQARKATRTAATHAIQALEGQAAFLQNELRNMRMACLRVKHGGAVPTPVAAGGASAGDCFANVEDADGQGQTLISSGGRFVATLHLEIAAAADAMKRFPGFDAAENIGAWRQNVRLFDDKYNDIDARMLALSERGKQLQASVTSVKASCIQ